MKKKVLIKEKNISLTTSGTLKFINKNKGEIFIDGDKNVYISYCGFAFEVSEEFSSYLYNLKNDEEAVFDDYKVIEFNPKHKYKFIANCVLECAIGENEGYIYLLKCKNYYKIGITSNPEQRLKKYSTENPFDIKTIFMIKVNGYDTIERNIKQYFKNKNHRGEWFEFKKDDVITIMRCICGNGNDSEYINYIKRKEWLIKKYSNKRESKDFKII